jgi:nucleoside-diphosphate-sugar epimerase
VSTQAMDPKNSKNGSNGAPKRNFLAGPDDRILVTGAAGFIGIRVVENLIDRGFTNIVCFVRPSSELARLEDIIARHSHRVRIEVVKGNLLRRNDCDAACQGVSVILHLAAGIGEKSFPDAFMNSVVATRNLLEAARQYAHLKRFTLVSSFAVYSNRQNSRRLDETSPVEEMPVLRGEAYCYAKLKQEECVRRYGKEFGVPFTIVRPGSVYGPGNPEITGRVGINTFGVFMHMGGSNSIPFTYVENCADAIVLAGIVKGIDGEIFNIVDDNTPSSRKFLRQYKKRVRKFRSVYVPHVVSYALSVMWEKYSAKSEGQLPPVFNRRRWCAEWRRTRYSNQKMKDKLGWIQKIPTPEAMQRYFESCARQVQSHA